VLQAETWSLSGGVHHWLKRRSTREENLSQETTTTTTIIRKFLNTNLFSGRSAWTWAAISRSPLRSKLYYSRDGTLRMTFYTRPGMSVRLSVLPSTWRGRSFQRHDATGCKRESSTRRDATWGVGLLFDLCNDRMQLTAIIVKD
jgi:hypothetical protein